MPIRRQPPNFRWLKQQTGPQMRRFRDQAYQLVLSPYRVLRTICLVLGGITLSAMLFSGFSVYSFFQGLPKLHKMSFDQLKGVAQKRVAFHSENKNYKVNWVPIKDVSRDYLYAVVMSEDATFFEHDGINFDAIMNSMAENLKERRPAYGASTISQQVTKNPFLENEKTLTRKLKEFFITRALEKHFSKNQILEIYLNIAEFGPEIFGAVAASDHFFHKKPANINAAEGVFMALMLPSPKRHYYSLYQNKNMTRLKKRKLDRVLRDMVYNELISEKQYREYANYSFFTNRMPAKIHRK